jgi:hypothetical protein
VEEGVTYQAASWRRQVWLVILVFGGIWVWATVSSADALSAAWSPLGIGLAVAIAVDQRARRMGVEYRNGRYVFHYAFRNRRFRPGDLECFRLEEARLSLTGTTYPAVFVQAAGKRTQAPALVFVRKGWREHVFGSVELVSRTGASPAIEEILNSRVGVVVER